MNNTFTIFSLQFNIYGLILGIAASLVIYYVLRKIKSVTVFDIIFVLITTVIGARILFIINNPGEINNFFSFGSGGLGLFGAIAGLILGTLIVIKKKKLPFLFVTDTLFYIMPLAQAIGRMGNYFNQELYGKPTDLPWAIYIDPQHRLASYENYSYFHPTFAYEAILNIVLFAILAIVSRKTKLTKQINGTITSLYLIGYGLIRLYVNTLRIDKEYVFGIENADLYSALFIIIGLEILIKRYWSSITKSLKFAQQ